MIGDVLLAVCTLAAIGFIYSIEGWSWALSLLLAALVVALILKVAA